ncbi:MULTISPECIES: GapS4b family protein [Tenacibaculum]|uniref:GAPS4b N-terminal domain-containing protein n=1 Tax=Tenacibaculum soleae TaxID=447689 RepID=A0A1B9Y2X8_9FLAO|nr:MULTISPECIES: hypothetical protein [Tenacibaculum]MCT4699168.1 hypothetical protein [Tenacibaculum haliotis]OCK44051.1 hypothetical protein BA195_04990 [Tenacibaculum soleae]
MKKDFLPQGDKVRQLLIKSEISSSKINNLLREKGVFIGRSKKNDSIPMLMKSIISPDDFEELYSAQKSKEESLKYRTSSIKCSKDFDLSEVFSSELDLNSKISKIHTYNPGYKVIGAPNFTIPDKNTVMVEYRIERENVLNDWTDNKTYHNGSVMLRKTSDGNVQISVQQNSTSRETFEVNNIIINETKRLLNYNSIINPQDDFISIKFKDFDNESRIKFFNSFMENLSLFLDFKSITDIDLYRDSDKKSHIDIKKFLDEIVNLKLNGKGLENHILLSKEEYHPNLIFSSVKLKYKLNYSDDVKGEAIIILSFPDYMRNKNEDSELQVSINFKLDKENRKKKLENLIRKKLLEHLEIKKINSYNLLKIKPSLTK